MKTAEFSPNDEFFKSPAGAVKANTNTRYRLKFSRPQNPEDVYLCITKDSESEVRYCMSYVSCDDGVYTYETNVTVTSSGLYFYCFKIFTRSEEIRVGADENLNALCGRGQDWQLTVFDEAFPGAQWLKGGIIYQIMPDRFNIGKERKKTKNNGTLYRDDWGGVPSYKPNGKGKVLNNDMFGGNLKGITAKLAYLNALGVTCIYLNPIFEARSNHKYDTGNYRKIDPDLGTEDDLKELIKKAAKKGIKIILDGVFSHTGDDSIYFNKYGTYDSLGAFQSQQSPYYQWYKFKDFEKRDYEAWWGIDILPNTDEENLSYDEFINGEDGIANYWTQKGIGGWRLDVVDEVPDKFLDRFVRTVKKADAQALVLGEVWEDASNKISYSKRRRYFQGAQLESVTNYPFKEDILYFVKCGDASKINRTVNVFKNNYPKSVLNNLMNVLGTHDTVRLLTSLGQNGDVSTREKRAQAKLENFDAAFTKMKLATLLQFTLPGVPCIYYGDEAGMEGFEDPFNRKCFPWDSKNPAVLKWYKKLGSVRRTNKDIFSEGDYALINAADGVYAFKRFTQSGEIVIIANNGPDFAFDCGAKVYTDLLTNKAFCGIIKSGTGAVLKETENKA